MNRAILIAIAMGIGSPPLYADVYKWVDEQGQVHYSDRPVDGAGENAEEIHISSPQNDDSGDDDWQSLQQQQKLLDVMQEERRRKQQARAQSEQEKRQIEANCEHARRQLERVRTAGFLYRKGADGERVIFTDNERAEQTARAEQQVRRWCR